jgi:hypothetical protein
MNLPNYFLADLPAEAEITPTMVSEACRAVKRNREQYLAARPTASIISRIADLAKDWLSPNYSFRKLALDLGPAATGFPAPTIAKGLDSFFEELTHARLQALIVQDLGNLQALEDFVLAAGDGQPDVAAMIIGPELMAHFAAGNIPNPTLMSIVLGLLTRSAQFVKCSKGSALIPRLFAHSLHEMDRQLASCVEIAEWKGSADSGARGAELTAALIQEADCVTATGSDETLAAIRREVPVWKRFVGYGHRLSFAFVSSGVLQGFNAKKVVARAVDDVIAWNQLGCLSPHVIYVEHGAAVSAEQFAAFLADELANREQFEPRGELPVEISAAIASRRSLYELRAAYSEKEPEAPRTRLWCSKDSTVWTVVYESEPRFQTSCLHRFIYVKGVTDLKEALQSADAVRDKVSTVGVAAPEDKIQAISSELARWGATRVCPLGKMQKPPLTWRHDGRPALGDLVRWTDWEQ